MTRHNGGKVQTSLQNVLATFWVVGDTSGIFWKAAGVRVSEDTLCLSAPRKYNIDKIRVVTAEYVGIWRN